MNISADTVHKIGVSFYTGCSFYRVLEHSRCHVRLTAWEDASVRGVRACFCVKRNVPCFIRLYLLHGAESFLRS